MEIDIVKNYIKMGYEEDLEKFFGSKRIVDCLKIIDDWNKEFFIKVFSKIDSYNEEDALLILDYLNSHFNRKMNKKHISKIYEKIIDIDFEKVLQNIPIELKGVYLLRHSKYAQNYANSIDPTCSIKDAYLLYKLRENHIEFRLEDNSPNKFYNLATKSSYDFSDSIDLLFNCCCIRKSDFKYFFVKYFDQILSELTTKFTITDFTSLMSSPKMLESLICEDNNLDEIENLLYNQDPSEIYNSELEKIYFILRIGLSEKYNLFILFDKIKTLLGSEDSFSKIILLHFIDPSLLCKNHILKYINCLVPLLNTSNYIICQLTNRSLNKIQLETKEIQNILPEIIQAFKSSKTIETAKSTDKPDHNFLIFIKAFESIVFNNYLCFNSLNLILQLLFKYLNDFTKESLFILSKINNIMKDKDIELISGLIFTNMCKFVINNNFYTKEALAVAEQFCLYVKFDDFNLLLNKLHVMRICTFMVGILIIKGDKSLNNKILDCVINSEDSKYLEPTFIAAASQLEEFNKYMNRLLPDIKLLFKDTKLENRNIATSAFQSILKRANKCLSEDDRVIINDIFNFLEESVIFEDFAIRMSALEIMEIFDNNLPLIYILRHDQHSLVRKQAQDIWKSKISNTNKILNSIYKDVLKYIKLGKTSTFLFSLHNAVSEMATKYIHYLEMYMLEKEVDIEIADFVLLEALKIGKMKETAMKYVKEHFSVEICKKLFQNYKNNYKGLKSKTSLFSNDSSDFFSNFSYDQLVMVCIKEPSLSLDIYKYAKISSESSLFIDYLTTLQKIEIIKENIHLQSNLPDDLIFILKTIESGPELESLLLKSNPIFSYYYLLNPKLIDHQNLSKLFERVFYSCANVEILINSSNAKYLRHCSIDNIRDERYLIYFLYLMMRSDDKLSYEKTIEILNYILNSKISLLEKSYDEGLTKFVDDQNLIYEISGYLLRNYISLNRRLASSNCLISFYKQYSEKMDYFKIIIDTSEFLDIK